MSGPGHVVNYRELWADQVMTALPMRVVADTREPLVLYLAIDLESGAQRAFVGYYVNFQEPLRSTTQGLDTVDLVLDIVVDPDGEWRMKDEDDFAAAVAAGHIDSETAELLRGEAARLLGMVERRDAPIQAQEWLAWRPPSDWEPLASGGIGLLRVNRSHPLKPSGRAKQCVVQHRTSRPGRRSTEPVKWPRCHTVGA